MEQLRELRAALRRLRGDAEVDRRLQALLQPLREYDEVRGADLTRTLETFLRDGGNITGTADRLFLHRNSVVYRLGRIQELSGLDLRDRGVRETLSLALTLAPADSPRGPEPGEERRDEDECQEPTSGYRYRGED